MQRRMYALTLLVLMIAIASAMLGLLSLALGYSDYKISLRQLEYTDSMQKCTNSAQRWICEVFEEDQEEQILSKEFTDGSNHVLIVTADVLNKEILKWEYQTRWEDASFVELFNPDK